MEEFRIKGIDAFLRIDLNEIYGFPDEICHCGGYNTKSIVEINSGSFKVKSIMYLSTGEVFDFYSELLNTNEALKGKVYLRNYEDNLALEIKYDINGHVLVSGSFVDHNEFGNLLKFEFLTDQSYIQHTLKELKEIVEKYGGRAGV